MGKKPNDPWNRNETNFKPLSKRLKLPSKPKKPRFFDLPSKCPNPNRTLNDDWQKKKKKSITPDETVSELLNPCRPVWTLNPNLELKPSDRRRSSKVTSTIWKSNSAMPTDKPTKPLNRLRPFKAPSKITSPNTTKLNDETKTSANKWPSSNDDLTSSPVKSKNSETPLNKPNEAENSLKPNSTSPTSDPTFSTPRTPLLSTRNENWRPNSNKPKAKSKNPSPNAETPKTKPKKPSPMPLLWLKNSRKNKINLSISRG